MRVGELETRIAGHAAPYPENDLAPVAMPSLSPTVLVVELASPFNTLEQLLAEARRRPGQINFGTNGVGSSYHLALERLKAGAKVDIQHVPYKGSAQLMPDLLSGRIDATIVTAFLADQQVKAGRVRAIATTSRERSRLFPSLPTVAESGLAAYDVPVALTVFAPGRTPKAILDRINSDILAIMREPAMVSMLERQGTVTTELRPDQLRVKMRDDVRDLEQLISAQGLKLAE